MRWPLGTIPRLRQAILASLLLGAPLLASDPAGASSFVGRDLFRFTEAGAAVFGPDLDEADFERDVATDLAPLDSVVDARVVVPQATVEAVATQVSSVGARRFHASGSSRGAAERFAADTVALGEAESLFDLIFQVTEATPFVASGEVLADPGSSFAFISLADYDSGVILFVQQAGFGTGGPFSLTGSLEAGPNYQLIASAMADVRDDGTAQTPRWSSFELDFQLVPEPSPLLLVALGLAALSSGRPGTRGRCG